MDNTKDTPETAPETVTSNEADVVKANDAESSQSGEPSESSEAKKLGELLLSYREKVGMNLDQAADAMCLTRGTLEALENEDFHLLPEAPYIRGYLRGYAKLAGVSSAEAVALYESIRGGDPLMQTPYHFTPSAKDDNLATQGLSSSLWKVIGVILLTVLLLGLWTIPEVKSWVSDTWAEFSQKTSSELADSEENTSEENSTKDEQANSESTNPTAIPESELVGKIRRDGDVPDLAQNDKVSPDNLDPKIADGTESNETGKAEDKQEGESKQDDDKPSVNTEENAEDSANETRPADDNATNNTNDEQAKKKEDSSDDTENTEGTDTNSNETEGETIAVDLSEVDTEAGEVAIKLVFEGEVWMRIKKKGGKQVFAGLRKQGEVHEMKAVKPLKFKVGNAPGVKIYINGKLFDQKPYQRGVVSRFEVE
ncbi:MAG: RodZ domain-containing protein [bacterium]